MNLETITHEPTGPEKPVNLLFVHGICVGAWVWERHFLPFFSQQGYRSVAISLRGHGGSSSDKPVRENHLGEYVDDVRQTLEKLKGPTVLIGHSFGGAVVQNFFQRGGEAQGMVLMASVPPYGLGLSSLRTMVMNPMLWMELAGMLTWGMATLDPGVIRKMVFSDEVSDAVFSDFLTRVGEPPLMASMELMGWPPLAPLPMVSREVLVMGSAQDKFVPEMDVRLTAAYYGTTPVILPQSAHTMMLEPRWPEAAQALLNWLEDRFSAQKPALPAPKRD